MKKTLLALCASALLAGCSPRFTEVAFVNDFRPYTTQGFYIYPEGTDYKEMYVPVADLEYFFRAVPVPDKPVKKNSDMYYNQTSVNRGNNYMMDKFVELAKEHGANTIINFKSVALIKDNVVTGYTLSGVGVVGK